MALLTTRIEVATVTGCRATLDREGWHSADPRLLERLEQSAPVRVGDGDPLYEAAQVAARAVGVRIILMRRRGVIGDLAQATTRLFRALTDSSLHRALGGRDDAAFGAMQVKQLRDLRLLRLALLLVALGASCVAYAYLVR